MGDIESHGAVYEFTRHVSGSFVAAGRLPGPPVEAGAGYGISAALSDERARLGASGASDGGQASPARTGVVVASGRCRLEPRQAPDVAPAAFRPNSRLTVSVAIDGARLAVGAPERAGADPLEGAVDLWDDDDRILADGFE